MTRLHDLFDQQGQSPWLDNIRRDWITSGEYLPWWVALATHLVFGWVMALMAPLGQFELYRRPTEG